MTESTSELRNRLAATTRPGFRGRLVDRGLARGLIWREGVLPPGAPPFEKSLTEDLLDYAHGVLAMALRLRSEDAEASALDRAFLIAGEAIEAAVHRGEAGRIDRGFNRLSAAVAFHLARYAARAYSILPNAVEQENLAPNEIALVHLLRRSLDDLHTAVVSWVLDEEWQDNQIAQRLREDPDFDETDAINAILTTSFMRGLALFDHAITTGEETSAAAAEHHLFLTAQAAKDMHAVSHWWNCMLALQLINELWQVSMHHQIPILPSANNVGEIWNTLRNNYIQRLRAGKRSAIEFWPSQLEAARRAVDPEDDLVVALPTSAGKTRIAELCILRALAAQQRVVYVTPLRALSAQIERDLSSTFRPLGFTVSALYGAAGIANGDTEALRNSKIVVSTPEKLDFALRNDRTIIDDVGLIVLDEGHMLGPNEREVRYEALVQRLLRREDAETRRVICLSALFPTPDEMLDLVTWIRQDLPGGPVYSTWRPTRQRFGVLQWLSDAARLDIKVEEESPFVPRFIEAGAPPLGSRRRNDFPNNKNELTLAAAWRFIEQEKEVLIYCALKKSVETLGKLVLKCIDHGVLQPLRPLNKRIQDTMAIGAEWLGINHPAVQCLQYGIALHHGGLPRPFLSEVERLLRSGDCPLTIASPTLAQGLNLSASVLLVPSIWRNQAIIPSSEFANVSGRAGRAFVDVEGLILHILWEPDHRRRNWALQQWNKLVAEAKGPAVVSGLLQLTLLIYKRIADAAGIPLAEVVEYVTGHEDAWSFHHIGAEQVDVDEVAWERDIASLDAAILALMDAETEEEDVDEELTNVLEGSLFSKQLARRKQNVQLLLNSFLLARVHQIWTQTNAPQRRGYHVAGVGLGAGKFLDDNIENLIRYLIQAEAAVVDGDSVSAAEAVLHFAQLVFRISPFRPLHNLPRRWEDALIAWLVGQSSAEVISICREDGVEFLQDALIYRLPWAMEAVRVHAMAVGREEAALLQGKAAMAVEAGSANCSVISLLRAGLISREAAIVAVESTEASFDNRAGIRDWLSSVEVIRLSKRADWPTAKSRHAWLQFIKEEKQGEHRAWERETQRIRVTWSDEAPDNGTSVVIEPTSNVSGGLILTPDLIKLGYFSKALIMPRRFIVNAKVANKNQFVNIEYYGPLIV